MVRFEVDLATHALDGYLRILRWAATTAERLLRPGKAYHTSKIHETSCNPKCRRPGAAISGVNESLFP